MKLELVRSTIPPHTAEALLQLAAEAQDGQYTGFVIGLCRPRMRYSIHCVGEACERPTWSRGICTAIIAELHKLTEDDDRETTI